MLYLVSFALFLLGVSGHSWVECSRYRKEIQGQDYDRDECYGFIREWDWYNSGFFSDDRGANYQPGGRGATGNWCPKPLSSDADYASSYSSNSPMAEYEVGETVRLTWPAKNHANYECFDNIPDNSMQLYMNSQRNPTSDPNALSDWTLVIDWHEEAGGIGDGIPFQNCPKFCDNTDDALCYGDFEVPDVSEGYYTFMWAWGFNSEDDLYTSCWEAYISPSTGGGDSFDSADETSDDDKESKFIVRGPVQMLSTDDGYDENSVDDVAMEVLQVDDVTQTDVSTQDNDFNVTIQVETDNPSDITSAMEDELCDAMEEEFGGACEIYADIVVYKTTGDSAHGLAPLSMLCLCLLFHFL